MFNNQKINKRFIIIFSLLLVPTLFTGFSVVKSYVESENLPLGQKTKVKSQKYYTQKENEDLDQNIDEEKVKQQSEETMDGKQENKEQEEIDFTNDEQNEPTGKVVYLTFDDGPSQLTDQFLDVLQQHNVQATFFMQGGNLQLEAFQNSVKRATKEGHYIGAHSMTHNYNQLYIQDQFVSQMAETLQIIQDLTGTTPTLTRAPYGSAPGLNGEKMRDEMAGANMKLWDWTIDSKDWALPNNPAQIILNVKNNTVRDREVVLMHETPQTLTALPEIIEFYKAQGYKILTYDESNHFEMNFQNDDRL